MCAHPSETRRKELSETTGLTENQVKFWFQNKRTYVKHLSGKEENYRLKMENEILRDENNKLKQIARLKSLLPMSSPALGRVFQLESSSENIFVRQDDTRMLAEIARNAVHEFVTLANFNGPIWLTVPGGSLETLSRMAYLQTFPGQSGALGLNMEATRAHAVVLLDSKNIVEFLMDVESYETFFPGIMSGATTTKVYNWPSNRSTGYDGALELVTVQVAFPSPLVPSRKCTFLRYCKKLEHGATAIVDIAVEDSESNFLKCRKMASGLLIQPIRPNSCKVTAIEHIRVVDTGVHDLLKPCLSSLLFGARRWVMSMARQCARIRDVFHVTNSSMNVSTKGRKIIMKMTDNLLISYAGSVANIPAEAWTVQCGQGTEEDVKVTYKRDGDSTNTAIVCATASFLLPVAMKRAFDLLKNNLLRVKWDVLLNGGSVKEEVRVANGIGSEDSVSILHIKGNHGKETSMILQNSNYDVSGSFLVYTSLDKQLMDMIMGPGHDEEMCSVPVFPTGYFLVPVVDASRPNSAIGEVGETVMTAGFQIPMKLARGTGLSPRSVSSAIKILKDQIKNVKDTLMNSHPVFYRRIPSTI
ncbi:hypothetical protein QOZ80_1BG0086230 [Eleusine coracana subsp. coracana]|nr:hypothetical protein QOZ80_1BG0086230 [Eleusine coracana subsp. coracana]